MDETTPHASDFLAGGGAMGALMRSMDWSSTPLGPVDTWPQSLRTTVSLCLSSTFPILIAWGPERVQIYNDAYRPICGGLHPTSMGQRFNECWASALPAVGHILDRAQSGTGSYLENLRMFLDRFGYLEEAFMTFSFSPIRDESGGVGGLFHPITETTDGVLGARRTQTLRELSARVTAATSVPGIASAIAGDNPEFALDLPFFLFYRRGDDGAFTLLSAGGVAPGSAASPVRIVPSEADPWSFARATSALELSLDQQLTGSRVGPYDESPSTAIVTPITSAGALEPLGFLVAGVSARRALDSAYRSFFEQLGSTLTQAVTSVRAYEEEQRRAEALAQIDRAKTAFFSNVSHEFRTPLTLMLGPLEDALADAREPLADVQRARIELVNRNGMRLLKLVNSLLDFSRIEAGRVEARFEPTDLAELTRDLASAFRSAVEKAGLQLDVHASAREPAWIDREMWEKVVLNLVSNAFKHTFEGRIAVSLTEQGESFQLRVDDTGVGVPESDLPRLFERFHRVEGARGRSYEGSGIGLALVQELVRMHGGSVSVTSRVDQGTTFTVTIPRGNQHLPKERLHAGRSLISTATRADAFVNEASSWVGVSDSGAEAGRPAAQTPLRVERGRVVLADDNADMREYVTRLLSERHEVIAVADGHAALAAVHAHKPDLLLSDVMMPGLDGFAVLRELRADPRTEALPIILLSARAGEEATLEGLEQGATDYLVKPFSARELVARVDAAIHVARAERSRRSALARQAEFSEQLVGIVSHDLRSPLNALLLGASTLLRREGIDERSLKTVLRMQSSTERALRLVRDLLDFTQARLGSGIPVMRTRGDIYVYIEHAVEELRATFPERELVLRLEGDGVGEFDGDRIAQVVHNLVTNAVKYGVNQPILIAVRGEASQVTLTVHNQGPAIDPELVPQLFKAMQRGKHSASTRLQSVGLGLFIVEQIALAHEGSVTVRSVAQEGTCFTVRLPRAMVDPTNAS